MQYLVNKATTEELGRMLHNSGVEFLTDNASSFVVNEEGNSENPDGSVESVSMGRVTGYRFPDQEAGSRKGVSVGSREIPGLVNRGSENSVAGAGSAGSPNQDEVHSNPVRNEVRTEGKADSNLPPKRSW